METIIKWTKCSEELPRTLVDGCISIDQYLVLIKVGNEYHVDIGYNWGNYIDDFWDTLNDWIEEEECHVIAWAPWPELFPRMEDDMVD